MTVAVQPARTYERVMVYAAVVSKGASNDFYIQGFESFLLPGFLPQPNRSLSIARVWRANRNMRSNAGRRLFQARYPSHAAAHLPKLAVEGYKSRLRCRD